MSQATIIANAIGSIAAGILRQELTATVIGRTSRGLFLRLPTEAAVFLTTEAWRGPLTLNLPADNGWAEAAMRAGSVHIAADRLSISTSDRFINLRDARIWQAPPVARPVLSPGDRRTRLRRVVERLQPASSEGDMSALLFTIAGLPVPEKVSSHPLQEALLELQIALNKTESNQIAAALARCLGYGPGLTPSGDDLVMGFMLALNRWGKLMAVKLDLDELNRLITRQASERTTALSANLIACACVGQADERLILALDGLMTGEPGVGICTEALAAWGSSSGRDALIGMALICTSPGPDSA